MVFNHQRPETRLLEHTDTGDESSHYKERRGKSSVHLNLVAVVVYSVIEVGHRLSCVCASSHTAAGSCTGQDLLLSKCAEVSVSQSALPYFSNFLRSDKYVYVWVRKVQLSLLLQIFFDFTHNKCN